MKKTKQYGAPGPDMRRETDNVRNGMSLENQELSIPNPGKGYTKVKVAPLEQGPAVPPLSKGRNWNATRPKAPQAAK